MPMDSAVYAQGRRDEQPGVMLSVHFGVRAMRKRGGGAIVNVSSMGGFGFGPYGMPEYGAAKAGVVRLTASLATLKERIGIRVNCVCPGWTPRPRGAPAPG